MKKVFWFTGLSGSGKTSLAKNLKALLADTPLRVEIIDGDAVRDSYVKPLGFSKEDILLNNKLIAEMCKKMLETADLILVPVISPYEEGRELAKQIIGDNYFSLIYCSAPLEVVTERDIKGLYKKASEGHIKNMIGMSESNPYIIPKSADVEVNSGTEVLEESSKKLLEFSRNIFGLTN